MRYISVKLDFVWYTSPPLRPLKNSSDFCFFRSFEHDFFQKNSGPTGPHAEHARHVEKKNHNFSCNEK